MLLKAAIHGQNGNKLIQWRKKSDRDRLSLKTMPIHIRLYSWKHGKNCTSLF